MASESTAPRVQGLGRARTGAHTHTHSKAEVALPEEGTDEIAI